MTPPESDGVPSPGESGPGSEPTEQAPVTAPAGRRWILAVLLAWVVAGLFLLESPDPPSSTSALNPSVSHAFLFFWIALVAVTWYVGPSQSVIRRGLVALAGVSVFAAGTEFAQTALDIGRSGELQDFAADAAGTAIAGATAAVLFLGIKRRPLVTRLVGGAAIIMLGALGLVSVIGEDLQTRWECRSTDRTTIDNDTFDAVLRIRPEDGFFVDSEGQHSYSGIQVPYEGDRLRCAVAVTDEFTILVRVTPENVEQSGPTRIVTSSTGIANDEVNFHLGQEGSSLSVRLRPGQNRGATWFLVEEVFQAGRESTIVVSYAGGRAEVYLDGEALETLVFEHDSLLGWDESFPLLVGDEFTEDRTFEGEIVEVMILGRAVSADEVTGLR